jgi:hypothetical protein
LGRLRKIFGPKRDEEKGKCKRLHNEELYDLHYLPEFYSDDRTKKNEMRQACRTHGGEGTLIYGFGGAA